ncbi:MAG: hypothetical protein IKJ01_01295, partial [Lachnospiraceae bacterium]|nr:hypothetical protein [Lachnospiraceae bacterium]
DVINVCGYASDMDSGVVSVTVNGNIAYLGEDGYYYYDLALVWGVTTTVTVVATDGDGNTYTLVRYVRVYGS